MVLCLSSSQHQQDLVFPDSKEGEMTSTNIFFFKRKKKKKQAINVQDKFSILGIIQIWDCNMHNQNACSVSKSNGP